MKTLFQPPLFINLSQGTSSFIFTYNTNKKGALIGFLKKGDRTLNPSYTRVYAPVMRSPLLFHNNDGLYRPTSTSVQPRVAHSTTNLFPHPSSPYRTQSRYSVQTPLSYNPTSYPYYSALPQAMVPSPLAFSAYSVPTVSYATTISSKGLSIILIATLMLIALDLVIVRPQKR